MEIKALLKQVSWLLGGAVIALVTLLAMGTSLIAFPEPAPIAPDQIPKKNQIKYYENNNQLNYDSTCNDVAVYGTNR